MSDTDEEVMAPACVPVVAPAPVPAVRQMGAGEGMRIFSKTRAASSATLQVGKWTSERHDVG